MVDLRRQARSLLGLEGRCCFCPLATSCSVGQPLAFGASHGERSPLNVVDAQPDPIAVTEVEFRQIPVQMGFAHMLIDAVNPALKDREIAFRGVGVGVIPDVFLGGMVDGLISAFEGPAESRCRRWYRRS